MFGSSYSPPHEAPVPVVSSKRGYFWVPGDIVESEFGLLQSGPMFVQWEAPEQVTRRNPVVLVHGGGGQGTDWLTTVDGRPGWADHFLAAGFPVYVVDRPGHGRSPFHPTAMGQMGAPFSYQAAQGLFLSDAGSEPHCQWSYGGQPGDHELDQLVAGMGPLPADLGYSQSLDCDRLTRLLDQLGHSLIVTHSAGAPAGWLVAEARPDLVKGVAAVEPIGPPFADFPGMGKLDWGLTAAPMAYDPPANSSSEVEERSPSERRLSGLKDLPVALFTGGASPFLEFTPEIVEFLEHAGLNPQWTHLPDLGIHGNGHGLLFEANSDKTITPVLDWIQKQDAT